MGVDVGQSPPPLAVSDFEAIPKPRSGGVCALARLPLSPKDRVVLDEILFRRPEITGKAIAQVLADHKIVVSFQTVNRHRRGDCYCSRP